MWAVSKLGGGALHALYKHSYSIQNFWMKNLMMVNVGRNM